MKLTRRKYQNEADFWRIRRFLREVMLANDLWEKSWPVMRLDYWRWHGIENCRAGGPREKVIFIWETSKGEIGGGLEP